MSSSNSCSGCACSGQATPCRGKGATFHASGRGGHGVKGDAVDGVGHVHVLGEVHGERAGDSVGSERQAATVTGLGVASSTKVFFTFVIGACRQGTKCSSTTVQLLGWLRTLGGRR